MFEPAQAPTVPVPAQVAPPRAARLNVPRARAPRLSLPLFGLRNPTEKPSVPAEGVPLNGASRFPMPAALRPINHA